mgnify:FL=1
MSMSNFLRNLDQHEPDFYPTLAGPVFEDMGFRNTDEIKEELRSDDSLLPELYAKHEESGVRPVQLKKIKSAINSLLHEQTREAVTEAQTEVEVEAQAQDHETQQADDMINLVDEPQQEQLNETQIRKEKRIDAINLISILCENNHRIITLRDIYERVGAQTKLEKNGVRYGVWESKDAGKIRSTSQRGTYEVC